MIIYEFRIPKKFNFFKRFGLLIEIKRKALATKAFPIGGSKRREFEPESR